METIGIIIGVLIITILLAILVTYLVLIWKARIIKKKAQKYMEQKGIDTVIKLTEKYLIKK